MKRSALSLIVVSLAIGAAAFSADTPPNPQELITLAAQQTESLRKGLEEKVAATDAAISAAAKAGTLKTSTEAYFRDVLDRFRAPSGKLPEWEQLYYPPKFDTSEEMEPINLAWSNLRHEAAEVQEKSLRILQQLLNTTADALQTAARSAEKPEELTNVEQLIAAFRKLPDPGRMRYAGPFVSSVSDVLARLAGAIRDALDARSKNDIGRLTYALQRLGGNSNQPFISEGRAQLPFQIETFSTEFRSRMAASYLEEMQGAQRELERLLIARKPATEIDRAIAAFEVKAGQYSKVARDPRAGFSPTQDTIPTTLQLYRTAAAVLLAFENQQETSRSNLSTPSDISQYTLSTEFRAFVSGLQKEIEEHQRLVRKSDEERQRKIAEDAEKQRQTREAERIALEQQQAQERQEKAMALVREKLLAIRTAQEALTLTDEMPRLLGGGTASRSREDFLNMPLIAALQQELRQLAGWWLDGSEEPTKPATSSFERLPAHSFAAEMKTVRDRAFRDVLVNRFKIPELREGPMAQISVQAAVESLASQAAERGEWKRSLELLQALGSRSETRSLNERAQAIRSFLTGMNFEQAEQFDEAVRAYQSVLQQVGDFTPVKEAAARLKNLRDTHPEAFDSKVRKDPSSTLEPRSDIPAR